jgi:hypothetical protein
MDVEQEAGEPTPTADEEATGDRAGAVAGQGQQRSGAGAERERDDGGGRWECQRHAGDGTGERRRDDPPR